MKSKIDKIEITLQKKTVKSFPVNKVEPVLEDLLKKWNDFVYTYRVIINFIEKIFSTICHCLTK